MGIDLAGAADRNAELVLGLAGRDLGVGLGIDVRVDAHRNVGDAALAGGDGGEPVEFAVGFDIDAEDALVDRQREFGVGLADTGEHDLVGGHAGRAGALEFAAGHYVGARAEFGERPDDGLVGVRLQRIAHQRRHIGERFRKDAVVPLDVAVE